MVPAGAALAHMHAHTPSSGGGGRVKSYLLFAPAPTRATGGGATFCGPHRCSPRACVGRRTWRMRAQRLDQTGAAWCRARALETDSAGCEHLRAQPPCAPCPCPGLRRSFSSSSSSNTQLRAAKTRRRHDTDLQRTGDWPRTPKEARTVQPSMTQRCDPFTRTGVALLCFAHSCCTARSSLEFTLLPLAPAAPQAAGRPRGLRTGLRVHPSGYCPPRDVQTGVRPCTCPQGGRQGEGGAYNDTWQ